MKPSVAIDLYSDIVCPWCFIGSERLERVLAAPDGDVTATVRYRPFLLQPTSRPEGVDIPDRLRRRYGAEPATMFARVEAAGRESGLELDLTRQARSYPTERGHTLLRLAFARGTQRALARALFRANFVDALPIADLDVLATLGAAHGFTTAEVHRLLGDPAELAATRAELDDARQLGIRGVPFFVFDGRLAVSGAQPEAVLRGALAQAAAA